MESSEDDAGTGTSASRRAVARERDIGQTENGNATGSLLQETSEAQTSCETPAMSEENYDGDSVPSPSTHDVNTSTEAILDMIDEFVDGPGAPKRLPHTSHGPLSAESSDQSAKSELPATDPESDTRQLSLAHPATSAKSEQEPCEKVVTPAKCTSHSESDNLARIHETDSVESPQTSTSAKGIASAESTSVVVGVVTCEKPESLNDCPPSNIPSSSSVETVEIISESSACQSQERTVKCVTSSDTCSVTVESAESTSSDTSISDVKVSVAEPTIRSPLRRRLVRPAPFDRRPDSTVSSTVDVHSIQQSNSENVTKDVSSSSDAVPTVYGNVKPEEIRNVSEVSVCKAETSMSPPKKIKLVRQKLTPVDRNKECKQVTLLPEPQQCQSTSVDNSVSPSQEPLESLNIVSAASSTQEIDMKMELSKDALSNKIIVEKPASNESTSKHQEVEECKNVGHVSTERLPCLENQAMENMDVSPLPSDRSPFTSVLPSEHSLRTSTPEKNPCLQDTQSSKSEEVSQDILDTKKQVPKLTIKLSKKETDEMKSPVPKLTIKPIKPPTFDGETDNLEQIPSVTKLNIKPIHKPETNDVDTASDNKSSENQIPLITKINIKPVLKPPEKINDVHRKSSSSEISESEYSENDESTSTSDQASEQGSIDIVPKVTIKLGKPGTDSEGKFYTEKNIPKLTIKGLQHNEKEELEKNVPKLTIKSSQYNEKEMSEKNIPKLTIKGLQHSEKGESEKIVPKLTIKGLQHSEKDESERNIPKLTIKGLQQCEKEETDKSKPKLTIKGLHHSEKDESEKIIPKLTIKGLQHSEKEESEKNIPKLTIKSVQHSEKEELDKNVPKITIKGLQHSEKEESEKNIPKLTIKCLQPIEKEELDKNVPKLTIKGIQQNEKQDSESVSTLKLMISQPDEKQLEKIPKLTIKTLPKVENQPLSPKLTIKPLKPPDSGNKDSIVECSDTQSIPKLKITSDAITSVIEVKENAYVPKITIKPVTRTDVDCKTKKATVVCGSPEHIPVVTKLNIKPILRPTDGGETSECLEDKVPVVSKLNIKPVIKPKDSEIDSSIEDIPKITKLNIKPLKNAEGKPSEGKDCDELNTDIDETSIPVVTKLNIKPIIKPLEDDTTKDSENQSSETGNSSDDNTDHIPVVTKLNIKPIVKPNDTEDISKPKSADEESIPIVTKLNIKPVVKPDENISPSSPKKDTFKSSDVRNSAIPVVTKLNIKPIVKPEDLEDQKAKDEHEGEKNSRNPPLVVKINMKAVADTSSSENLSTNKKVNNIDDSSHGSKHLCNNIGEDSSLVSKSSFKHDICLKSSLDDEIEGISKNKSELDKVSNKDDSIDLVTDKKSIENNAHLASVKQNCVPEISEKVDTISLDFSDGAQPSCSSTESTSETHRNVTTEVTSLLQNQSDIAQPSNNTLLGSLDNKQIKQETSSQTNIIDQNTEAFEVNPVDCTSVAISESSNFKQLSKQISSVQNCTLLKKLLETTDDALDKRLDETSGKSNCSPTALNCQKVESVPFSREQLNSEVSHDNSNSQSPERINDSKIITQDKFQSVHQEKCNETIANLNSPLEVNVSDKIVNQSSGQDSPRIILKINKTDYGSSAKIITEEDTPQLENIISDNTQEKEIVNDKGPKKNLVNSRRKQVSDMTPSQPLGKRLRSSRIVENTDSKPTILKRNVGKRPSPADVSPPQIKPEPELSALETKRLKLGQLLSNKSLTITPVKVVQTSPAKPVDNKQAKTVNHTLLNNENCSKNGNSKLHNILSNLQAKQMQVLPINDINCSEKNQTVSSEVDSNISSGSGDMVEIVRVENCHPEVQEMMISESFEYRDFSIGGDDVSQDPLEVDNTKLMPEETNENVCIPKPVELTPQPKKRGRPRKLPVSEGAKPIAVALPVPALEERPQRSLRLSRDRPAIIAKPRGRGRGRGRGGWRAAHPTQTPPTPPPAPSPPPTPVEPIDPTSSRIKLPRMTEALDKMPSVCTTPLSSRRRSSSLDSKLFPEAQELKVVLDSTLPKLEDSFMKSPESSSEYRGRGGRGWRGRGRGARTPARTPRGRGRGRGGGRGAMYMKETLGIYGRVCGPATTTVQLFEEETCMMDDNATPAKPSHLLDEDSQSSVKSSTNESSKMKRSKFADLFDSNKVWTAADVKEYMWPPEKSAEEPQQVMMIQEQVAMFLGVKSFKRRYPELKRRTITGDERDHVLAKGIVTEALCDLGITAVDASEVLDIMLSDYPHKYEEYRSHQRERQLAAVDTVEEVKVEDKVDVKPEVKPVEIKQEQPKVDPEKTRQELALAAIASAGEWNARLNASRARACADLQSLGVQRPRAAQRAPPHPHVRPPHGFYPHALLPGQYQHAYRVYTPEQLRYFPVNTVVSAPPPPPPSPPPSDSEPDWGSRSSASDDSDAPTHHHHKRKRLTKVKRSSQTEGPSKEKEKEREIKEESREPEETCRACGLRLEANRKYTHERFLVCANCNAKLHPGCVELGADTIRKCREYAWQCAECKSCCACRRHQDDDKMLFCDLCDRGFHIYCVGLDRVPQGRWHCVECAICKSCGARDPSGPAAGMPGTPGGAGAGTPGGAGADTPGPSGTPDLAGGPLGCVVAPGAAADWHHQTRRGPGGHKVYSHSLCTPCARVR